MEVEFNNERTRMEVDFNTKLAAAFTERVCWVPLVALLA